MVNYDIDQLEKQYKNLFVDLNSKLDQLIYWKAYNELNVSSPSTIESQYQIVKGKLPQIISSDSSLEEIKNFLRDQNTLVRRESLLEGFLPVSQSFLKATHQANSGGTTSEFDLENNIKDLYLNETSLGSNEMIEKMNNLVHLTSNSSDLYMDVAAKYKDILHTKMDQLRIALEKFSQLKQHIHNSQAKELAKAQIDHNELVSLKSKLLSLQQSIQKICVYAEIVPTIIMGSSKENWAESDNLIEIIEQCNKISDACQRYKSFCEKDLGNLTTKELLFLDLQHF